MVNRKSTKGQTTIYKTYAEEFEGNKGVIRISKSKKDRQHNDQKTEGQTKQ
jgi:hypothetical protein